jgi:hypothetical protein
MMATRSVAVQLLLAGLLSVSCVAQETARPSDVYVIRFSHLDLYWAGTHEEGLSRGNRILTRAIQLAEKYPEFRFRIDISPKWAAIYQSLSPGEPWFETWI